MNEFPWQRSEESYMCRVCFYKKFYRYHALQIVVYLNGHLVDHTWPSRNVSFRPNWVFDLFCPEICPLSDRYYVGFFLRIFSYRDLANISLSVKLSLFFLPTFSCMVAAANLLTTSIPLLSRNKPSGLIFVNFFPPASWQHFASFGASPKSLLARPWP